ncbi:MAG: fibronectin type III domain-containing protein [Acidimicrobiales bacterium]
MIAKRAVRAVAVIVAVLFLGATGAAAASNWVVHLTSAAKPAESQSTAANPPTGGSATNPTSTSLLISWSAPSTGAPPSGYTLTRNGSAVPSGSGCFGTVTTTSCTDSGLTANSTYTYTVSAVSGSNWTSSASSSFQGTTATATGIALVQQVVAGSAAPGSGNTVETPTLSSPPTNGDTLVLLVGDDGNHGATVSTVSGGGVTTWTKVTSAPTTPADAGEVEIWYGLVSCSGTCTSSAEAVTVTMSQNTNEQLASVSEWSGILKSSPVDSSTSSAGTASGSTFAEGPISLSQTGDLIITDAWVGSGLGYSTGPVDATTGYTALSQTKAGGSYYRAWAAYQIDSSAAPISATWTENGSNGAYAAAIAAFKP